MVAEDNREIVGLIIGEKIKAKGALIWYLTVNETHRGKGIGHLLMNMFKKNCRNMKIHWIELYCPTDNDLSQKFYKDEGFKKGQLVCEFEEILIK